MKKTKPSVAEPTIESIAEGPLDLAVKALEDHGRDATCTNIHISHLLRLLSYHPFLDPLTCSFYFVRECVVLDALQEFATQWNADIGDRNEVGRRAVRHALETKVAMILLYRQAVYGHEDQSFAREAEVLRDDLLMAARGEENEHKHDVAFVESRPELILYSPRWSASFEALETVLRAHFQIKGV